MQFGSAADRVRERSRRVLRELFAFWILGGATLGLCVGATDNIPQSRALAEVALLVWVCGLFVPAWALYRLIRFAIAR